MITQRSALHVAYVIATGRENPGAQASQTTPEAVLAEVEARGHLATFELAKAPDIVAAYKAHGVAAAVNLLRSQGKVAE